MTGAPFSLGPRNSTPRVMLKVLAALVPGIVAHYWFFGPGIVVSLLLTSLAAVGFEAFVLLMRNQPVRLHLTDGSALVTAWLLALSLPTLAPWWLYVAGSFFAIVVAKHLYGGLGQNVFNPAMVGYAALIVSFPLYMTQWPAPLELAVHAPGWADAFDLVFAGQGALSPDAYTSATPLDSLKTQILAGRTVEAVLGQPIYGLLGGVGGEWVALAFLAGGAALLAMRLTTWHIPLAFLAAVALSAGALHLIDPARHAGPLFHLMTGGVMLGAFFIATDPVTASTTPLGKLVYAGGAGLLTVVIRTWGGFPDGVAFAVLLMNMCVPFIDDYTQPRVFGKTARLRRRAP